MKGSWLDGGGGRHTPGTGQGWGREQSRLKAKAVSWDADLHLKSFCFPSTFPTSPPHCPPPSPGLRVSIRSGKCEGAVSQQQSPRSVALPLFTSSDLGLPTAPSSPLPPLPPSPGVLGFSAKHVCLERQLYL